MAGAKKNCKSFEQEMGTLSSMTEQLSSGELSLEDSMRVYEDGMKLVEKLSKDLTAMEARLEQIDLKTCEISSMQTEGESENADA